MDRISIPDSEDSKLVLHCEMTRNSPTVVAYLSTSDNLNASRPIMVPEDAVIEISTGSETAYRLFYDADLGLYNNTSKDFSWDRVTNLTITAELPGESFPKISAEALPFAGDRVESVTSSKSSEISVNDQDYFERDITIKLSEPTVKPAYFELELADRFTTSQIGTDGEVELVQTGDETPVMIVGVNDGGVGMINMAHRDGLLIDHSRLVDNTFSIKVRSPFPIQDSDQVFEIINTSINSISKDYYLYHKAYSNTVKASGGQYSDPAIWNTNIKDGFGLFAVKTKYKQPFTL